MSMAPPPLAASPAAPVAPPLSFPPIPVARTPRRRFTISPEPTNWEQLPRWRSTARAIFTERRQVVTDISTSVIGERCIACRPVLRGWTYTVLYGFPASDGAEPSAGPTFDSAGNLYGTTTGGGSTEAGTVCCEVIASRQRRVDGEAPLYLPRRKRRLLSALQCCDR